MQPNEKHDCTIIKITKDDVSNENLENSYEQIKKMLEGIPVGGRIVFDLGQCSVLGPSVLLKLVTRLQGDAKRRKKGILKGRHFIVLDPSEDVELLLKWFLKEVHWSLIVAFSKAGAGSNRPQKILNLPEFLRHPLEIIESREGTTARELEDLLGKELNKEYKTPARVCIRQLFQRGLVIREGYGGADGHPHFIYRAFKLPKKIQ